MMFCLHPVQGFLKLMKSCSHFPIISYYSADFKNQETMAIIGYSIQGLVAKLKDIVANGYG